MSSHLCGKFCAAVSMQRLGRLFACQISHCRPRLGDQDGLWRTRMRLRHALIKSPDMPQSYSARACIKAVEHCNSC